MSQQRPSGGMADTLVLEASAETHCRFDSCLGHHANQQVICSLSLYLLWLRTKWKSNWIHAGSTPVRDAIVTTMNRFITCIHDAILGKPVALRSSRWETVRKHFLRTQTTCAACGIDKRLQVHHIKPFHLNPRLELDPQNLIVLCEYPSRNCHLNVGHHGNWKAENPNVVQEAALALARSKLLVS